MNSGPGVIQRPATVGGARVARRSRASDQSQSSRLVCGFGKTAWASALSAALLAACGGGGGDAGAPEAPVATTPFALQTGYAARLQSGTNDNFTVSGDCAGTASVVTAPAVPASFAGVSGYSVAQTSTVAFSLCTPKAAKATGNTYYNTNYVTIGLALDGGEYAEFATPPAAIPALVKVGDKADLVTLNSWNDSSKTIPAGTRVLGYSIEPDTLTTAIANFINRAYDQGGRLLSTEQSRYRMAADGSLTMTSIDVQFSTTSRTHLLYTVK